MCWGGSVRLTLKLNEKKYPHDDEIVWHDDSVNAAISKLIKGEDVWVCSRKLSLLIKRYGKEVVVEPLIWRRKVIFRVANADLARKS